MCQVPFDNTHLYAADMFVHWRTRTERNFNRNTICLNPDSFGSLNQNVSCTFVRFAGHSCTTQGYIKDVLQAGNCFLCVVLKLVDFYSTSFEHIPPHKDKSFDCCSLLSLYSNTSALRKIANGCCASRFTVFLTTPLLYVAGLWFFFVNTTFCFNPEWTVLIYKWDCLSKYYSV